jgi:predicted RNA binding protein YcfA (HicA-like mRNA interferase family)
MKLPCISGLELAKAMHKLGFEIDHQTGSHLILRLKEKPFTRLTIPRHKTICTGTLLAIMRQAGISREKLLELL